MGKYNFVYGAKEGKKHIEFNIPCQDSAYCVERNGAIAAVLSDGCGSEKLSQYGSKITATRFAEFLADNFNDLVKGFDLKNKGNATLETRKVMVEAIVNAQLEFVRDNKELFYNTFPDEKEKYENDENCLTQLYATLIFYAEKDDLAIYGQIGDGVLGLVDDVTLKITLEEKKTAGEENYTIYPWDIYRLSKTHELKDKWYAQCRSRLINSKDVKGAILTSDGVDSCFDRREAFKKKYIGVAKMFKSFKDADERGKKELIDKYLGIFQQGSRHGDDVSFVALYTDDCDIQIYETKEYPVYEPKTKRPPEEDAGQTKEPEFEKRGGSLPKVDRDLLDKYLPLAKDIYDDVNEQNFEVLITESNALNEKIRSGKFDNNFLKDVGFENEDICKHSGLPRWS